ncbi:fungal-specific transcription factor domain-containing protein [Aspergillus pseudotamarii]|uniref:Fungal-specific transcription factor domain-containing protein n=1 Tax=Aspergillus pseudotamarii TaxID=132259 RepID=A0A5N6T604_ASPPS|nr:fungal-specific transcription factor domain-containing protein [Aspergillus pseudotamarii]KAE8141746.1 fungal-specific transcription factor domain-containing protein [Aspergillus pseudotamarii]
MSTRPVAIAPAIRKTSSDSNAGVPTPPTTRPYNCQPCVRRKVKCDRAMPSCASCQKAKLECFYKVPQPPRKRKRRESEDVYQRLARYERMLQENGLLSTTEARSPSCRGTPGNVHEDSPPHIAQSDAAKTGRLVSEDGKSRYINSRVWLDVAEVSTRELSDNEGDDQATPVTLDLPTDDPLSATLLGGSKTLSSYHPPYPDAMKLWTIYIKNVDPLCKVLHIPTTTEMIERVAQQPTGATRAQECLLFAVYHFAVYSITDEDCMREFERTRSSLMSTYQDAMRQGLVNASWLKTTELQVLQAYVLFLMAMRTRIDPHTFWIWTGVAIRISQRMGLHRDGENLDLPPFDVEMRRRLFWQLIPVDGYAGQMSGTGISIAPGDWDTNQPLNINDDQIYPDMKQPPNAQHGASEMIFCLTKAELSAFYARKAVQMNSVSSNGQVRDNAHLERSIDQLESDLEMRYLRYCDIINPVHILTLGIVRAAVNMVRLRSQMPFLKSQKIDEAQRRELCVLAEKILDTDNALYANPDLRRFQWHIKTFFVWDAMICILSGVATEGFLSRTELDRTWEKIIVAYSNHPEILERKRALHAVVTEITRKAWISNPPSNCTVEPAFISTLRSQRETRGFGRAHNPDKTTRLDEPAEAADLLDTFLQSSEGNDLYFDGSFSYGAADWMFWDQA